MKDQNTMKSNLNIQQPLWLNNIIKKSKEIPCQGQFNIQGLAISLHSYDPETYLWVEKYLYPLNLQDRSDTQSSYRINILYSDDLVQSVLNGINNSEHDTKSIYNARRWFDRICIDEYRTVDYDPTFGMLWVTDCSENTITLVMSVKVLWPFLEMTRTVRDLITRFLEDQGWVLFHAGAIQANNKNYMLIGDEGAGKTSLIIALLAAGSTFISNERVFVKIINGAAHMLSFPMPIAVGLGTMVQYPELIKYIRQPQLCLYPPRRMDIEKIQNTAEKYWPELEDKVQFLPQEITQQFSNITGIYGGIIDGLVVPCFQKNQPARLEPMSMERFERIVINNCIDRSRDEVYPPWMPLPYNQPGLNDVNNTVSYLLDLPNTKFIFSADKNRRNEMSTYPERLHEIFE